MFLSKHGQVLPKQNNGSQVCCDNYVPPAFQIYSLWHSANGLQILQHHKYHIDTMYPSPFFTPSHLHRVNSRLDTNVAIRVELCLPRPLFSSGSPGATAAIGTDDDVPACTPVHATVPPAAALHDTPAQLPGIPIRAAHLFPSPSRSILRHAAGCLRVLLNASTTTATAGKDAGCAAQVLFPEHGMYSSIYPLFTWIIDRSLDQAVRHC